MDRISINKNYIDHYLQAEVIKKLASSEDPVRFSNLKDDGIDNSLFMYHVNKLIDRGLVEKSEDGFTLTVKGVRWANFAGVNHDFNIITPRPLIQFVILNNQNEVLISSRRGQLKDKLNAYLFPGNVYQYGKNLENNSVDILNEIVLSDCDKPNLLTIADIIFTHQDGFTNHVISHIFEAKVDENSEINTNNQLYSLEWMSLKDINENNPIFSDSLFVPIFMSKIDKLGVHETFEINQ